MSMNNAAHTPGPWIAALDGNNRPIIWGPGMMSIADCYRPPSGDGFFNARLIAAAPELLAALQDLHSRLRECAANPAISAADAYDSDYQESVADAIAKATGGAA